MTNRLLSKEEKDLCEKNLKSLRLELAHEKYYYDFAVLMLEQGLDDNYLQQVKKHTQDKKDRGEKMRGIQSVISVTEKQVREGVKIKDDTTKESK